MGINQAQRVNSVRQWWNSYYYIRSEQDKTSFLIAHWSADTSLISTRWCQGNFQCWGGLQVRNALQKSVLLLSCGCRSTKSSHMCSASTHSKKISDAVNSFRVQGVSESSSIVEESHASRSWSQFPGQGLLPKQNSEKLSTRAWFGFWALPA